MDIYKLIEEKRENILAIASKHGARNVRIIGSVARREADPDSDLDLLVELETGTTLLDHAALIQDLETLLRCKVDVASDRGLRERVKDRVLQEAVPL
jgi:predicted nucleotidyltransferase